MGKYVPNPKFVVFNFRVTKQFRRDIRRVARKRGLSASAFVRGLCEEQIEIDRGGDGG